MHEKLRAHWVHRYNLLQEKRKDPHHHELKKCVRHENKHPEHNDVHLYELPAMPGRWHWAATPLYGCQYKCFEQEIGEKAIHDFRTETMRLTMRPCTQVEDRDYPFAFGRLYTGTVEQGSPNINDLTTGTSLAVSAT